MCCHLNQQELITVKVTCCLLTADFDICHCGQQAQLTCLTEYLNISSSISIHFTLNSPHLSGVFSLLQEFSVQPSSVLVLPGSNATLSCLVLNMGAQAECRWQKDGKPVGIFPGKYSLPISGSKGDCSLRIAKVDAKLDEGSWECQVTPSNINMKDALTSFAAKLSVQSK